MALTRTMSALIGAMFAAAVLPSNAAADWPERPITLLHGFGAGGNGDLTARAVAERLSARLGQSVVVEPKPGAGGRVAAGFVARAPADGYTLFMLPGGHAASAAMQEQMNYHPLDDFTFIGLITQIPFIVVTYPEHPIKTVPELVAAAKAASDPIVFSTSGVGTGQHLAAELFAAMANIKLKHLPSRGGTAVPTMLLGKHIELGFEPPPSLLELLKDGKLRAVATTGPTRFFALPDVPTIGEAIPGYEVTSYFGLAGPPNLPADILKRLNAETVSMTDDLETVEKLKMLGSLPLSSTPEGFKERVASDIQRWSKLMVDAGIKPAAPAPAPGAPGAGK
jgi:tripartite-type tricarboxylate transporter receptor subunit TctC